MKLIPRVLNGSIRIFRQGHDLNREILLYYIDAGETCMMSLVASFAEMISQVHACTERKSKLLLIPTTKVRDWQIQFPKLNNFIIQTFLNRYTDLLNAFNEISFKKIDDRLNSYLRNYNIPYGDGKGNICIAHQELANELGTARVLISPLLKNMEYEGLVTLKRGKIELKKMELIVFRLTLKVMSPFILLLKLSSPVNRQIGAGPPGQRNCWCKRWEVRTNKGSIFPWEITLITAAAPRSFL